MYYINFYFRDIIYDEDFYFAEFSSPDDNVKCNFSYNRATKEFEIWNNSRPIDEITPIPVWWLDKKLEENGLLRKVESKISY